MSAVDYEEQICIFEVPAPNRNIAVIAETLPTIAGHWIDAKAG
jgi:hypothetical protein